MNRSFGPALLAMLITAPASADHDEHWQLDSTTLTMAPDDAWGTGTDQMVNRSIYLAIKNCKAMSKMEIGCGAYQTTIRGGWSLGIRCGRHNILVADRNLHEAEHQAFMRESNLREFYAPKMPSCVRVVTVDPSGTIILPKTGSIAIFP